MSIFCRQAYAQALQPQFGFADIVDKIKPAVISVSVRLNEGADTGARGVAPQESPLERFFRRFAQPDDDSAPLLPRNTLMRQGSGFFITADGYAVTNNHVVEGVSTVEVKTDAGKIYTAKVVGADRRTDVALIKVDGRSDFPTVKFAERIPRVGDWVLAVGNPFGLGGTVTAGIVSARGRDIGSSAYDDFLQIDAPVNVGNSGGPSFNIEGDVIGVNTAIFSPSGGSVGIGFAVPADIVKPVIDPAAGDFAPLLQLIDHRLHDIRRHRETAAHRSARRRKDRGIDPDDIAFDVEARPAGITHIHGASIRRKSS